MKAPSSEPQTPTQVLSVTGASVFRTVLLDGSGLALAAPFIAEAELRAGKLVALLPEYRPVEFAINAIYPHRRYLAATVRAFIDMSVERFVEDQHWMDPPAAKDSPAAKT
jgi:DNA-binding transcriptional LysR family regulator